MNILDFLVISLVSTTLLMIIKTIQELLGHHYKKFSIYKKHGILIGIINDVVVFYPLIMLFDFFVICLFPIIAIFLGIDFVWVYIISVLVLSLFGMHTDLVRCKKGTWFIGDFPLPMHYLCWLVDYWANGTIVLLFLNEDVILFNVVMMLIFIGLCILVFVFRLAGLDEKIRNIYHCDICEW